MAGHQLRSLPSAVATVSSNDIDSNFDYDTNEFDEQSDSDWIMLKDILKNNGIPNSLLQAIENKCPSLDVIQLFVEWSNSVNAQVMELKRALGATNRMCDASKQQFEQQLEEMKEILAKKTSDCDSIRKQQNKIQSDFAKNVLKIDQLELSLQKERSEKAKIASELASCDLTVMELKARNEQLETNSGKDVEALTEINKNLAQSQLAVQKSNNLLKEENEKLKLRSAKLEEELNLAQSRTGLLKEQLEKSQRESVVHLEQLRRDHERALKEVKPSELRKMEEMLRLQNQLTSKLQDKNQVLHEQIKTKNCEIENLREKLNCRSEANATVKPDSTPGRQSFYFTSWFFLKLLKFLKNLKFCFFLFLKFQNFKIFKIRIGQISATKQWWRWRCCFSSVVG